MLTKVRLEGGGTLDYELMFFFNSLIDVGALRHGELSAFFLLSVGHLLVRAKTPADRSVELDANGHDRGAAFEGWHGLYRRSKKYRKQGIFYSRYNST